MQYPRMIYLKSKTVYMVVHNEKEHREKAKDGWLDHWEDKSPAFMEPVLDAKEHTENPEPPEAVPEVTEEEVAAPVHLTRWQRAAITRKENKGKNG